MLKPTPAEWESMTDKHCDICGPEPACYLVSGIPWPMVWRHERCQPEADRQQQEALQNVTIG